MIGIDGVPKPESIVTKATTAPEATATPIAEAAAENIVDTLKAKVNEAIKLVKGLLNDGDDVEEKAEL